MIFFEGFMRFCTRYSLGHLFYQIFSRLLVPSCILCGQNKHLASFICIPCEKDLPMLMTRCRCCAQKISGSENLICGACQKQPPPFELSYALFPYEPPISKLITALKFHSQLQYANLLGELLLQKIRSDWYKNKPLPDLIIPIPLHHKRLQERGFNQALEIAKPIANALTIPLESLRVQRIKNTRKQSELGAAERYRNMQHAFKVVGNYDNLCIAVLDDVVTTGHTVTEFCQILKQHGAKSIHIWCCARHEVASKLKKL